MAPKIHRMRTRFVMNIGIALAAVIGAIAVLVTFNVRSVSIEGAYRTASTAVDEADRKMGLIFEQIERLSRSFESSKILDKGNEEVMLDLFYKTVLAHKEYVRAIYFGTSDGRMLERGFGAGFTGGITKLPDDYDPRTRPWYGTALQAGGYVITKPYMFKSISALGVTTAIPVIGAGGAVAGVLGIDMTLDRLGAVVNKMDLPFQGKGLIVDAEGKLIASQFGEGGGEQTKELAKAEIEGIEKILASEAGTGSARIGGTKYYFGFRRNAMTGWTIIAALPELNILRSFYNLVAVLVATFIVGSGALFAVVAILVGRTLKPLTALTQTIERMSAGDLSVRSGIRQADEIGILSSDFDTMAAAIEAQASEIRKANEELERRVAERTSELAEINTQLVNDLEVGRRIQLAILPGPGKFPVDPAISIGVRYQAMEKIGGDLFDVIQIGRRIYGFLIADVSGHGVAAALVMTMLKVAFHDASHPGLESGRIVSAVNEEMFRFIGDIESYATAFFAVLDAQTGILRYTNAGHHPAVLFNPAAGTSRSLDTHGSLIGSFEHVEYETSQVALAPGDRLFLYTDGLVEARNTRSEFFEYDRLMDYVSSHGDRDPDVFVSGLFDVVDRFCNGAPQNDDRAAIVIKYAGVEAGERGVAAAPSASRVERARVAATTSDTAQRAQTAGPGARVQELYKKASGYLREGKFEQSVELFKTISREQPNDASVLNGLGVSLFKAARVAEALAVLEKASALHPGDVGIAKNLVIVRGAAAKE